LPFFIPLAILLKLTGEGYIFYSQVRVGLNNKPFRIIKFATMLINSPGMGTGSLTLKNDWRVTPLGKYLRKSKINEVPQILNVFVGNMSIVGPRPLLPFDFEKFPEHVKARIYKQKPGLTGIGSVIFRDFERFLSKSSLDPHEFDRQFISPYKGELELWYQDNCSFKTDLFIIFLTLIVVFYPNNNLVFKVFKDIPPLPNSLTSN
jgi:lipopolysaccharide/colanic/teichoic acid biosynthesis glycosyltransferase